MNASGCRSIGLSGNVSMKQSHRHSGHRVLPWSAYSQANPEQVEQLPRPSWVGLGQVQSATVALFRRVGTRAEGISTGAEPVTRVVPEFRVCCTLGHVVSRLP